MDENLTQIDKEQFERGEAIASLTLRLEPVVEEAKQDGMADIDIAIALQGLASKFRTVIW